MPHRVTLIPGDGIGPELSTATRRVLEATGVEFDWDVREAGADVMAKHGGNPLPDSVIESIAHTGVAIKGPITTPVGTGFRSVNVALRKALDLFAQVRPCKSYEGVRSRYRDVDLVIVRENTEDLYAGIEFEEGTELRYRDDVRMGKVYLGVDAPGLADIGPDAGTLSWSEEEFSARAKAKRSEIRNLLQDQTFVSGIGNAYADEVLWAAKLHPKRRVGSLSSEEMGRLHGSLRSVLGAGLREVEAAMPPELGKKPREHMQVRGRAGSPCRRCGATIMRRRKGLDDVDLCPKCQPAPKGQLY